MRTRLLAAVIAAALATLAFPGSADANHSWGNYHWARTANPFTVELDNNVTSAWSSYLSTASADWTTSSVLNTTIVNGSFGSRSTCTPATGRVEVCNANYGNTGWLGIASISITGGVHITRAYVKVNDTYFSQAQYNTPAYRRLVMCQEVGHTFGLGHQDENQTNPNLGSCMDYSRDPDGPPNNEHPNAHDFNQLQTIYAHTDSFSTTRAGGTAGPVVVGNAPASWGRLVEGSATPRGHATYCATWVAARRSSRTSSGHSRDRPEVGYQFVGAVRHRWRTRTRGGWPRTTVRSHPRPPGARTTSSHRQLRPFTASSVRLVAVRQTYVDLLRAGGPTLVRAAVRAGVGPARHHLCLVVR